MSEFKQLPTFDVICARLSDAERCIAAQGELLLELMQQIREREYEITFLMNISYVTIPTSTIADANGKVPATRKSARDVYMEQGRAKIVAMFEARAKAEQDAQGLQEAIRNTDTGAQGSQGSTTADDVGPIDFRIPGKVTH